MLELIPKIIGYKWQYWMKRPLTFPMNFTVSVTYKCNSRCKTCNIYKKKVPEFSFYEFEETFKKIGKLPYWITFSGGEPFLRKDFVEICQAAYRHCRPKIINVPTNGILFEKIPADVRKICASAPDSQVVINLSLDQWGEAHDEIRQIPGNFKKAMKTYDALKKLKMEFPNLVVGIHSVISRFNVDQFQEFSRKLMALEPDSYITEIAEERVELDTMDSGITPALPQYGNAVDFLSHQIKNQKVWGFARITQGFRLEYYKLVKNIMRQQRQILPCYAGWASCQISPDGDVWTCCIRAESVGNLRDYDFHFRKLWKKSKKLQVIRKSIKNKECYCPLANASYTNMLLHPPTVLRVIRNAFFKK